MKINEKQLRSIIRECIKSAAKKNTVSEGSAFDEDNDRWEDAKETLGAEEMLVAIYNYLDGDTIRQLLEYLGEDYDLWQDDDEHDVYED